MFLALYITLSTIIPAEMGDLLIRAGMFQLPEDSFDFQGLALLVAATAFGLIGVFLAGGPLFGDQAERAKRVWLPGVFLGLVLITLGGAIIAFLS